jgi:hypothetical protein
MKTSNRKHGLHGTERGIATIEFAVTAGFFFMMIIAVVAGGHFFWTHNALVESTRRGARYAAMQCRPGSDGCDSSTTLTRIQNMVLYNDPAEGVGAQPMVSNLQRANIVVDYSERPSSPDTEFFGVAQGTVSVRIINYNYNFVLSPVPIPMPPYETTVRGESAGYVVGGNTSCN